MATIIRLSFAPRKPAPRPNGATAQVIIFPGVRYERAEMTAEKPKKKRRASTKSRAKRVIVG